MTDKSGKTDMEENPLHGLCKDLRDMEIISDQGEAGSQEAKIKEFGLISDMKATEAFLTENPDFINETSALALLKWCSVCASECDVFDVVSTQTLYILYLLDLARHVDIDPGYCVEPFFNRINQPEFYEMFEKEIVPFRERLKSSSWNEVFDEVLKTYSSDGSSLSISSSNSESLDPIEVFESLPEELRSCIENEDIDGLETVLNEMPTQQADAYMNRFLQAGLFVPIEGDRDSDSNPGEDEEEGGTL